MIKRKEKGIAIAMILVAAGLMIYCGYLGWTAYLLPLQYIGFVLAAIGLAGLAGVNICVGPLAIEPDDDQDKQDGPTS
jgi:hypothetical protein